MARQRKHHHYSSITSTVINHALICRACNHAVGLPSACLSYHTLPADPALSMLLCACAAMLQDFPYFFEAGVAHEVMWAGVPPAQAEIVALIREHCGAGREFLWWVNPTALQSITSVSRVFTVPFVPTLNTP